MNKKEISEIKRLFTPDRCPLTRICGCYVDAEKNKKSLMKEAFLSISEEEMFKYFDIFKKTLSGTVGKNLLDMEFPLAQEAGESCCLAILDHDEVRYLDVVESAKNHVMIRQRVGGSAPLHCTGSGKLFLCQYPPEKLAAFASKGLRRLTPHTRTSTEELEYELRVTRERGYAVDNEECEIGMSCLAEPIYDINHKIIAAISLSGPISRMTNMRIDLELIPSLRRATKLITEKINGFSVE